MQENSFAKALDVVGSYVLGFISEFAKLGPWGCLGSGGRKSGPGGPRCGLAGYRSSHPYYAHGRRSVVSGGQGADRWEFFGLDFCTRKSRGGGRIRSVSSDGECAAQGQGGLIW
jgi:hypothetical protein